VRSLAILGGGSWGTALAIVLAHRFDRVTLWVYEADLARRIAATRENDVYLPGFQIPANVEVFSAIPDALQGAEVVLSAIPSQFVRATWEQALPELRPEMLLVSATKGLESRTLCAPSQIITEVVSRRFSPQISVLSGPSFAREVANQNPTAIVIASRCTDHSAAIQSAFSSSSFRLYTSSDPTGVEVAASLKNVVAVGAGVVHGLALGHNAMAALITRGLAEITRLAVAMGGKAQTLAGLAGLGDLVLTCTGELSRNRTVGLELAAGRSLDQIVGSMRMIAEGIKTTAAARELAARYQVEMPITEQMYQVLHFGLPPREAIRRLMERSLRGE